MIRPLIAVFIIFIVMLITEFFWRYKKLSTEVSRKVVHIFTASFVATWPLFMSWGYITLVGIAFLLVVILSWKFNIFRSIHSVERTTWGEFFFAVSIILISIWFKTNWIFAASMLHLGVADGMAALLGTRYGQDHQYRIFGHKKTLTGSLTFLFFSILILGTVAIWWGGISWIYILWLPFALTILENLSIAGTDDLFVPVGLAFMLTMIRSWPL
jgi:phytol kinase